MRQLFLAVTKKGLLSAMFCCSFGITLGQGLGPLLPAGVEEANAVYETRSTTAGIEGRKLTWSDIFASPTAPSYDEPRAIAVDDLGNIYVAGTSTVGDTGADFSLVKYDRDGNLLWSSLHDLGGDDVAYALRLNATGNILVSGASTSPADTALVTLKYSADGTMIWDSRHPAGVGRVIHVLPDSDGGSYVTATHRNESSLIVKYGDAGHVEWSDTVGLHSSGYPIALDGDGGLYTIDPAGGSIGLIRYDSQGEELWTTNFSGESAGDTASPWYMDSDADGNAFVVGVSSGTSGSRGFVFKAAKDGTILWSRYVKEAVGNFFVTVDPDGAAYVAGIDATLRTLVLTKYDGDAVLVWQQTYKPDGISRCVGVDAASSPSGIVAMSGYCRLDSGDPVLRAVAYSPAGTLISTPALEYVPSLPSARGWVGVRDDGQVYLSAQVWNRAVSTDFIVAMFGSDGTEMRRLQYGVAETGNNSDGVGALTVDGSDNIIVGVSTTGSTSGFRVRKYSSEGIMLWDVEHGYQGERYELRDMVADGQGRTYTVGVSHLEEDNERPVVSRLDSEGEADWTTPLPGDFIPVYMGVDRGDRLVIAGVRPPWASMMKLNEAGGVDWSTSYPPGLSHLGNAGLNDFEIDDLGNTYLCGSVDTKLYTAKFGPDGVLLWEARFDEATYAFDLAVDGSGNVYVAAGSNPLSVVKYDADGNELWTVTPGATHLAVDAGGSLRMLGLDQSGWVLTRRDPNGDLLWSTSVDAPDLPHWVVGLVLTDNGDVVVVWSGGFIEVNEAGEVISSVIHNPNEFHDIGRLGLSHVAYDSAGDLIAGGSLFGLGWSKAAILRYKTASGVAIEETARPLDSFSVEQNYPNPFRESTTVSWTLPSPGIVGLTIVDVLGREVRRVNLGYIPAGKHQAVVDAIGLSSGMYFYRLEGPGFAQTRTMAVVR